MLYSNISVKLNYVHTLVKIFPRSRRDLAYLAEINEIAPRFSSPHRESWDHSEISLISARKARSRRDSPARTAKVEINPRSRRYKRDLAEILEVAARWLRWFRDLGKSRRDSPGRTEMVEMIPRYRKLWPRWLRSFRDLAETVVITASQSRCRRDDCYFGEKGAVSPLQKNLHVGISHRDDHDLSEVIIIRLGDIHDFA